MGGEIKALTRLAKMAITLMAVGVVLAYPAEARVRARDTLTLDFRLRHVAVIGDSYTTGLDEGGPGPKTWTSVAQQTLAQRGAPIVADISAELRAGYGVPGDHGSIFKDLTARAVKPDDALVVFFGSRNDQSVEQAQLIDRTRETFDLAHRFAPAARLLVIGPPWPTADVPHSMLMIRDVLNAQARAAGAAFVDPIADRWFVDRPDLIGPDRVHPTGPGNVYLADKIAPLIHTQLSA